jgi:hypothetical protein
VSYRFKMHYYNNRFVFVHKKIEVSILPAFSVKNILSHEFYGGPRLCQTTRRVGLDMAIKANYSPNEAADVPQAPARYSQAMAADPFLPEPYKTIHRIRLKIEGEDL